MPISNKEFVFAAMAKTGTSYVQECFSATGSPLQGQGKHDSWLLPVDGRMRVTIVRNPVAWVESMYCYLSKKEGCPGIPGIFKPLQGQSLAEFADNICKHRGIIGAAFSAFTNGADIILRTESLGKAMEGLLEASFCFGPVNRTVNKEKLSTILASDLMEAEREFCDKWGYS